MKSIISIIGTIYSLQQRMMGLYLYVFLFVLLLLVVPVMSALGDEVVDHTIEQHNEVTTNAQTITLLDGSSFYPFYGQGGAHISVDDNALTVDALVDVNQGVLVQEGNEDGFITTYVVQSGDTISQIAEKFGVSVNTVIWANDLRGSTIRVGQELVILPVSGVRHTVAKGDTISSIVKKYEGNMEETLAYNGLVEDELLEVGREITIPYGIDHSNPKPLASAKKTTSSSKKTTTSLSSGAWTNTKTVWVNGVKTTPLRGTGGPSYPGYYLRPIVGYGKSRGLHGFNAVDFAAPRGTPILAAAGGTVIVAKYGGWNGGYGQYVTIKHPNGTQTLYAHMSVTEVYPGQTVVQGQVIGRVGTTGNSTGNHLHFEIRGAQNPF